MNVQAADALCGIDQAFDLDAAAALDVFPTDAAARAIIIGNTFRIEVQGYGLGNQTHFLYLPKPAWESAMAKAWDFFLTTGPFFEPL